MQKRVWTAAAMLLIGAIASAAEPPTEAAVTDADGKEVKVSALKFGTGTRRLSWLADPNGTTDEAKNGPLVLEVREPHSTTYIKGVITFVPVESVESIKFNYDKKTTAITINGLTEPLTGTLEFKGLNVLGFSGTAEEKAAAFSGGAFAKGNIKAVAFPNAKPLPPRKGVSAWQVQIDQPRAMNPTLRVGELKFLYQFPGGVEEVVDAAAVRKGDPLKLNSTTTEYTALAIDNNANMIAAEVRIGGVEKVVIIPLQHEKDGKTGSLAGVIGEVDAGWKLFPLQVIKNMKRPKLD